MDGYNIRILAQILEHCIYLDIADCGVRPLRGQGRIVGGKKSKFGDWPWQVSFFEQLAGESVEHFGIWFGD